MEAKGHEKLMDRTTSFLDEKLKSAGYSDYNLNCYYLGNWIADFSQLNDESIKFIIYKVACNPGELIDFAIATVELMEKSLENLNPVFEFFLNAFSFMTPFWEEKKEYPEAMAILRQMVVHIKQELKDVKTSVDTQVDPSIRYNVFRLSKDDKPLSLDEVRNNPTLNHIELALVLMAKFIGYNKFCLNARPVVGTVLDPSVFNEVFDDMFRKYLPHEHLDRRIDLKKLKKAQNLNSNRLDNLVTSGEILDDRKKGNDKNDKSLGFYTYLDEYLTVACNKLNHHEEYFKGQMVVSGKNALNKEIARLGQTMHVFQDYFAHSNFIDFSNVFLFRAMKSNKLEEPLHKSIHNLFCGDRKYSEFENWKSTRATLNVKSEKEDNRIFTGYFDWVDTKSSLYHMLMGAIGSISEIDPFEPFWDQDNLEVYGESLQKVGTEKFDKLKDDLPLDLLFMRKAALTKKLADSKDGNERKELEIQIQELNEHLLSKKQFRDLVIGKHSATLPDFVTLKDTKALFSYRGSALDAKGIRLLTDVLNNLVQAKYALIVGGKVKNTFEKARELANFIEIIFSVIRVIILIYYYPQNVLRILLVAVKAILPEYARKVTEALLKQATKDILERLLTDNLENFVGRKYNIQTRHGSHSLMAKDDDFKQPKLSGFALDMAENVDRFILINMFFDSKKEALQKLEIAIHNNLNKTEILGNEYDLASFGPVKDQTKEELFRLLTEKDRNDKRVNGLHKSYCDWDFYLKNMISFRNGIPASSERLPAFRLRNLRQDPTFNLLKDPVKFAYFMDWEKRHAKIKHTVPLYTEAPLKASDGLHVTDPGNINKKSFKAYIDALNKAYNSKNPPNEKPIDLPEIEVSDSRLTTWFFRILTENKQGYRDNTLLDYLLPKTIAEDELDKVKVKGNELEKQMIKEYEEIAIRTTYIPEE